jgi:hypothetical protein
MLQGIVKSHRNNCLNNLYIPTIGDVMMIYFYFLIDIYI